MKIEILGCSGSVAQGYNTTSILLNDSVLLDAGSAASVLPEERLRGIRHILLTHAHIDHVKELPFILDALYSQTDHDVTVWGSANTIEALRDNIFNGVIWPRVAELNRAKALVSFRAVPDGGFAADGLSVETIRTEHIPGSLGYLVSDGPSKVMFSGDTGLAPDLFHLVKSLEGSLKALFVEVSFPDRMEAFAKLTMHLTPSLLGTGLAGLAPTPARVFAYHIKPRYLDEVVAELPPNVAYITGGEVFRF